MKRQAMAMGDELQQLIEAPYKGTLMPQDTTTEQERDRAQEITTSIGLSLRSIENLAPESLAISQKRGNKFAHYVLKTAFRGLKVVHKQLAKVCILHGLDEGK